MSARVESFPIDALRRTLAARGALMGCRLEYHLSIASTNDRARELADAGDPEGSAVLAGEQTRGRGRAGRTWHSPPGLGAYLSVVLRPAGAGGQVPVLTLAAAVGAAWGLREATGVDVRIKWPNDLVVAPPGGVKRKIGGILTEGRAGSEGVRDVVVGIGVNVNHAPGDFPDDLRGRAGSLSMARGRPVDPAGVVLGLLAGLERWYLAWRREGSAAVVPAYRGMSLDLEGRAVRVVAPAASWSGVTAGLDADGALLVRREGAPQGSPAIERVIFGEVERVEEA